MAFDETIFPYSKDNAFTLSELNIKTKTPVSNFSSQSVYHLPTLFLPNNSFKDDYLAGSAAHQQTPSVPAHTDTP